MKEIIIIFSLLFSLICEAQHVTVKIMGLHSYEETPILYGITFSIIEEETKDSIIDNNRILEQRCDSLSRFLKANGLESCLKMDFSNPKLPQKVYKLEETSSIRLLELIEIVTNHGFSISKSYYIFKDHDYKDEDYRAKLAVQDAKNTANAMMNHLDFQIIKVLNIDDVTNVRSNKRSFYCSDEDIHNLLIKHGFISVELDGYNNSGNENESSSNVISGTYKIWVSFLVKPKK